MFAFSALNISWEAECLKTDTSEFTASEKTYVVQLLRSNNIHHENIQKQN